MADSATNLTFTATGTPAAANTSRLLTSIKALEYRVTQRLQQRPRDTAEPYRAFTWSDRLIAVLSVTVGLVVVGSFLEELVWAVLAAATVYGLGFSE